MNDNSHSHTREQEVGFFALVAVILVFWGWGWLKGISPFHPPQRFIAVFHDVAGLNNNAPVNINGVRIGTVEKLELVKKGLVNVGLKINTEAVKIPHKSEFTIQTLGLVGAKYVEITLPDQYDPDDMIGPGETVKGKDPVRVELVMNRIATNLGNINFNEVESNISNKMERVAKAADAVEATSKKFGDAANDTKEAAHNAKGFFGRGEKSFNHIDTLSADFRQSSHHITALADDWRTTSHKVNKILDNPALSSDLKETAQKAKETASNIQSAVHELNKTIGDKPAREDVLSMLTKINSSTDNIYNSVKTVDKIAGDQGMRTDVKQMLSDARNTMDKANEVVTNPNFKDTFTNTAAKVRLAATRVNLAARQLSQVLDQRFPLFKMMFGRPGHIADDAASTDEAVKKQNQDDQKAKKLMNPSPNAPPSPRSGSTNASPIPGGNTENDSSSSKDQSK